jgi:hypothetical protein
VGWGEKRRQGRRRIEFCGQFVKQSERLERIDIAKGRDSTETKVCRRE